MDLIYRPHSEYSIFTHSVGSNVAGHSLIAKLHAIADAGFDGIELFQDDLDVFAKSDEFRQIQREQERLEESQQGVLALTPPDSPGSPLRHFKHTSKTPGATILIRDDMFVRNYQECMVAGSDGLPLLYNAHGVCTTTEYLQEAAAAKHIASVCTSLGLRVYTLQPLRDFEGWVDPEQQRLAMQRARSRFEIMSILGADLLLICSNNQKGPSTTGDFDRIGRNLAELASYADEFGPVGVFDRSVSSTDKVSRPIRVGFEALSWGAHIDIWADAWRAVRAANRPNVGLILDSFNTLGRQYADPCTPSGIVEGCDAYGELMDSLKQLSATVPPEKIFFLQIGDARKMPAPLPPSPNEHEPRPARMIWSRGNRLFPCERELGAFMPVREFVQAAVLKAGYCGPWSIEVFNSSLNETDENVPISHARRARDGLDKLVEEVYA